MGYKLYINFNWDHFINLIDIINIICKIHINITNQIKGIHNTWE